jgi:hypothetical protein
VHVKSKFFFFRNFLCANFQGNPRDQLAITLCKKLKDADDCQKSKSPPASAARRRAAAQQRNRMLMTAVRTRRRFEV